MAASKKLDLIDITGLHVGVIHWHKADWTGVDFCRVVEHFGCKAIGFQFNEKLPTDLDVVIASGPFGSLVPVVNQILALPVSNRPAFVLMMSEQLPNPHIPEWFRYSFGKFRTLAERIAYQESDSGVWEIVPWLRWLTTKGFRYRYYGDLYWLQREKILTVISTSSLWTAGFLRVLVLIHSSCRSATCPIKLTVTNQNGMSMYFGWARLAQRAGGNFLQKFGLKLKERQIEIMVVDGVERPFIFGKQRTELLNRTKIVLKSRQGMVG